MTIPEQAVEAAAKAAFNAARAWAGEDDPTSFADGKIREVYTDMVRAAINAYTSTLPPLRAREEIARAVQPIISSVCSDGNSDVSKVALEIADAILSRTAGQEWRDISTAKFDGNAVWLLVDGQPYLGYGEAADWLCKEDRWFVKASFRRRSSDKRSDEIYCVHGVNVAPTHWMPLPAPPVAEPIVADKSEVKL